MHNKQTIRRLLWALLLSVLAHMALVGELPWWPTDEDEADNIPIKVTLLKPPASAKPPPAKRPPKPKPKQAPAKQPVQAEPIPYVVEPIPPDVSLEPVAAAEEEPLSPMPPPEAVPEPPVQAADEDAADEAYQMPEDETEPAAPMHVEAEYRILRNGGVAGTERHSFRQQADGSYLLSSIASPKGLLSLALSELRQTSEGHVTEHGLRPDKFLYQYGNDATRARKATFDWQAGALLMESGSRQRSAELPPGAQDLLSFMYQFMYAPPLQNMQLEITNGKRLRTYLYMFDGEEALETEFGKLQCIKISRTSNDGEEKTEIWLANEYHHLPVKIRMTDEEGAVTERTVSRLLLE